MTDLQWFHIAKQKHNEQHGMCGVCGEYLELFSWPRPQLAHRIKRGKIVRTIGKKYEWHPMLLTLVCAKTKGGKSCNDGALLGAAHPVAETELLEAVLNE